MPAFEWPILRLMGGGYYGDRLPISQVHVTDAIRYPAH